MCTNMSDKRMTFLNIYFCSSSMTNWKCNKMLKDLKALNVRPGQEINFNLKISENIKHEIKIIG